MRIVSTLASATEIVSHLGLDDRLVGISHECDFPPHLLHLPRVSRPRFDPRGLDSGQIDAAVRAAMRDHGSVYEIDDALLASLEPDLILAQAVCEVCAVPTAGVRSVVEARGLGADIVSLDAHTIEQILGSIEEVGRAAGAVEAARTGVGELRRRLEAVRAAVDGATPPRVLAVEWLDPPFAPGHWVPEMVTRAGGRNLAGEAGAPSRQLEWVALEGSDPDVLVVMPCGFGVDQARAEADAHADRLLGVAPRAVAEGRAYVVDGSAYFNRSGPRFVTGVEILAGLLHPDRHPPPAPAQCRVWAP